MNYGYGPQAHGTAKERNLLRREATAARRQLLATETPQEKQARDLRGLRRAVADLEPLRSPWLPEIGKRIEALKAEIASLEARSAI